MADQNFRVKRGLEVGIGGTVITATASGSVGIGTTSVDQARLEVDIDATTQYTTSGTLSNPATNAPINAVHLQNNTLGVTTAEVGLVLSAGGSASGQHGIYVQRTGSNTGNLIFRRRTGSTTSAETLRIDTNGDVGIGTTNPGAKLNVVDNSSSDALRITQTGFGNALVVEDSTNPDATPFVIDSSGNVGIGTINPQTLLQVGAAATQSVFVTSSGNVGIGTTNPSTRLEIVNTANDASLVEVTRFTASNASGSTNFRVLSGHSNVDTSLRRVQLDTLRGDTNFAPITITQTNSNGTSERVRIDASGSVGIGTTNPAGKIEINNTSGTHLVLNDATSTGNGNKTVSINAIKSGVGYHNLSINGYQLIFKSGGSETEYARIDSAGNVGIGTTNPATDLDVFGDISVGGNTTATAQITRKNTNAGLVLSGNGANIELYGSTHATLADRAYYDALNHNFRNAGATVTYVSISTSTSQFSNVVQIGSATSTGTASQPLQVTGGAYFSGSTGVGATLPFNIDANHGTFTISGSDTSRLYFEDTGYEATGAGVGQFIYDNGNLAWFVGSRNGSTTTGSNELFRVLEGGNVGIGTTNPQTLLQVGAASTQSVFVTSTGRVGVGTTNPAYKMEIWGDGTVGTTGENLVRVLTTSSTGYGSRIILNSTNITGGRSYHIVAAGSLDEAAAGSFIIKDSVSDVARLVINSSGSVGIGTTNPTAKLEPVDTAAAPATAPVVFIQRPNNVAPASIAPTNADLRIKSHSSNVKIYAEDQNANPLMILTGSGNLGIGITNPGSALALASGQGITWGASNYPAINGSNTTNTLIFSTQATERVRIDGSGNLGIGTNNPAGLLHVGAASTQSVVITSTGSMVIGGTSTSAKLYVDGGANNYTPSASGTGLFEVNAGATSTYSMYIGINDEGGYFGHNGSGRKLFFDVNETTRMTINASGNVGIGTTNPTQALHVQGNTLITGIATVSSTLIASSDVTFNTTASNINLGTSQTTGRLILGGPSQTGQITLGFSTSTHTLGIATGASGVGTTKTINLGTGGLSGSNTQINIGPSAGSGVISVGTGVSVGIGTAIFNTLGHGGTNVITQINNTGITTNSQSHLILSSAAAAQANSSVGTISWGLPTASATNKGIAYIAGLTGSGSTTGALSGKLVFATRNTTDSQFAERMVLNESGRVGIGSTLPTAALTIGTAGTTTTGASQIYLNGATSNRIDFNTNGIAGPSTSTRSAGTKIVLYPGVSATGVDFGFGIESSTLWSSVGDSSASFKWYAGTTNIAVLKGDGSLGIGTTNPAALLDVAGEVKLSRNNTTQEGGQINFARASDNAIAYAIDNYADVSASATTRLRFLDVIAGQERMSLDRAGNILVGTGTSTGTLSQLLQVNSGGYFNGSVGIGITNPGSELQVAGPAAGIRLTDTTGAIGDLSSTGWLLYQRASNSIESASGFSIQKDSGADVLTINSSGNLGIGITDPLTLLHLNSTDPTIRLKRSDAAANAYGEITSDTSGLIILKSDPGNAATNSGFSLTVDNIERVRVGSAGSVGIGITNATSRLYVLGDLASEYAATFFNDGNNANRFGIRIQCGVDTGSGTAIAINDGDGTNQGNVTFNAGTVTYGAFTANHDCVIPSYSQEIPYGSLMIVNKILYKKRIDGTEMERGIIYESGISTLPYVKNLLGAYSYQYDPDSPMQQAVDLPLHQVLVLGDGHIRCCNENGNIKIGDGITSSSMEGVGMRMNKIGMVIGIAQEDVDFTDANEVKLVPVQYGLHQYIPDNISEYLETLINQ